ncbi:MAG: UvrD-helicase domain-containing protein [Firmicutes bacterium]|nr:UvrD-helicase domain-containing protein [Bacillota bacterium]
MDYLKNLNDRQREAVLCTEGPLLVIAGAGSGKTTTMTRRIAYLIGEKGVDPYNILAVTFTNKAAEEMRSRIEAQVDDTRGMWVMTFHAACLRILRRFIDRLGYRKDFTIYDTTDQKTVIKECLAEAELDEKAFPPAGVLSAVSKWKNSGASPERAAAEAATIREKNMADLYRRYMVKLMKYNALDFDDLLVKAVELLNQEPEVLQLYSDRFHYIMIDEYQDTNEIQYELVRLLAGAHGNICAVGDEDQCIYQWRGATIRNILEFEEDFPGAKIIKLEQNYRSCGNILGAANSVIQNNTERKGKILWTSREEGERIRIYKAATDRDEAFHIAREIHKMKDKGYAYSDIAVLYRTHSMSRGFEESFSRQDIPYRVIGGTRFYDRKEIKDILCYMRLIQNPGDNISFRRVINEPRRGLGDKSLEKLDLLANLTDTTLFDVLEKGDGLEALSGKAEVSARQFMNMIRRFSEERGERKISEIYDALLRESGYLQTLEAQNTIEAAGRIENLMEFKSVIYDFEDQDPDGTYEEFLEKIALLTDVDNLDPGEDAVSLMTLHSAKGLEFAVVFIPGMEEGAFPVARAYDFPEDLEEERRLCYVGMTRAKDILYMSGAAQRLVFGQVDSYRMDSRFLEEVAEEHADRIDADVHGNDRGRGSDSPESLFDFGRLQNAIRFNDLGKQMIDPARKSGKTAETAPSAAGGFSGGERVKHKKYGEGMVVGVRKEGRDEMITIIFDNYGTKVFDANIVKLKKL